MKYLAPIPKQFVDHNGLPLSDGKVHVYISGDTQYANVYQDADGEELMPNPARLDSNGAWVGFVTAGVPLDYVVKDAGGNVQFEYENVVAGGGGEGGSGPIYVQESHTSSDSNVTVTSQKTACTFDSNLNDFTGELHVRFQNSGQAATVTFYVNNEYYDKAVSTLSVMSGITHLMVPLSVKYGRLRAEVTFATASTPDSVKFDLAGYNLGTGGGGSQVQADWNENDSAAPSYIKNKPTIPAAQVQANWSQSDNSKVDYIKNKPRIPAAQVNSDWAAIGNVERILNKPMYFPNTSTNLSKVLTADDVSNGYVDFVESTSGHPSSKIIGVTSLLFARFGNFMLNNNDPTAAFDTMEIGLRYTDGGDMLFIEVPHSAIEDDKWEGWGMYGNWTMPTNKWLNILIRLNFVPGSVNVGDEVFMRWNAMLVCNPGMF